MDQIKSKPLGQINISFLKDQFQHFLHDGHVLLPHYFVLLLVMKTTDFLYESWAFARLTLDLHV